MVSINNPCGVDSTNTSPVYGQSKTFSPPMFSGENLTQPTQDGFVSTQPEKEKSFYQKNKALIWVLGIGAAVGAAFVGHKMFKLDKELGQKIEKMTESVTKLDKDKVVNDAKALAKEHKLKDNQVFAFVDLKHSDSKKIVESLDKIFVGKCKDADYAMMGYSLKDNDKVDENLLKLYKTKEVDPSIKELMGDKDLVVLNDFLQSEK